jgi:Zn-dependent M16 (insulinase) family peptidase
MQGTINVFPVFLDHILNPTLLDSQFVTEVYHMDHNGKNQGVVYCEMASRENTEADLLDLNLRRLLYQNETTYSFECGGLTPEIQKLTNDNIKEYHKKFYHLDNATAIVCGEVEPQVFLKSLEEFPNLFDSKKREQIVPNVHPKPWINPGVGLVSKTVYFPSVEDDIGTIAYGSTCLI